MLQCVEAAFHSHQKKQITYNNRRDAKALAKNKVKDVKCEYIMHLYYTCICELRG